MLLIFNFYSYKRLGLARTLGRPTGGEEKQFLNDEEKEEQERLRKEKEERLKAKKSKNPEAYLEPGEARIIRDDEGNVVKVIYGKEKHYDSDESEEEDSDDDEDQPEGLKKLIELSKIPEVKYERHQTEAEQDWIRRLVEKHGDDYEAMKWDTKLNIYQQSAGDIKKRVLRWKKQQEKINKN